MTLNLQQIASMATELNGGRTDYTLSSVSFYANLALQEVATRIEHQPLQAIAISSTTSGENKVTLPTDFLYLIDLSMLSSPGIGNQFRLTGRDAPLLDSVGTQGGIPTHYAVYADWLEIAPSPDSSYSLQMRYGKRVTSMISSMDTPGIDERYHVAVAYKTAEMLAQARNDYEQEAANRGRYTSYMQSTPTDLALRQRDRLSMRVSMPHGWNGWGW